jgi:SpoVK/Ycf46/Vps4 family AAA+-type ATPase
MLETADNLGGCVLFFDDFDKGFSGWESNADGGVARRLSQKLLTWMQGAIRCSVNHGTQPVHNAANQI